MSSFVFTRRHVALSPLMVRGTLAALAAGALFLNGISSFAAVAVLIALLVDQWRGEGGGSPALDVPVHAAVGAMLACAAAGTATLLDQPGSDAGQVLRNLGNALLIALLPLLLTLRWTPARLTMMAVRADVSGPFLAAMALTAAIFLTASVGLIAERFLVPNQLNRVVMHVCIFGWFAAAAVGPAGKPRKAVWLILGLLLLSALSESATAAVAMAVGAVAYFGCLTFARGWVRLQTAALIGFTLATPLIGLALPESDARTQALPFSWGERIAIWEQVADKIAERPLTGWGFKSSDVLDWTIGPGHHLFAGRPITHAHNTPLQIFADLGIVGFAGLVALMWITGRRVAGLHRNVRPYAAAAMVSAYVVAGLAVDFWTDNFLAMLALTALLFRLLSESMSGDNLKFAFVRRGR